MSNQNGGLANLTSNNYLMKTRKIITTISAILLAAFALLTLFLSSSVLFDWFGIRAKEGNYVLFIVWANFISSILYLLTSYGLLKNKEWTIIPIKYSFILLLAAFLGLYFHIDNGGEFEIKTVYAMGFRITLTLLLFLFIKYKTIAWEKHSS